MRAHSSKTRIKTHSEMLTVMFVDLVDYTKTTAGLSREHTDLLLNAFETLPMPILEKHGGTLIKKMGDALLVTFKSPTDAVLCGVALQHAFNRYNYTNRLRHPLKIRAAIHTGEVLKRNNDVFGDTVNTASRIESIAKEGQVVFSDAVFLAMNKNEVPFVQLGWHQLRGVKYPIRLFCVKRREDEIIQRRRMIIGVISKVAVLLLGIAFVFLLGHYLWYNAGHSGIETAVANLS